MKDIYTTLDELTLLPAGEYLITRQGVVLINRKTLTEVLKNEELCKRMLECLTSEKIARLTNKDCQW